MVSPCEFFGFFFGCHQRKLALHDCRYPQKTNPMTRQRKFCNSDTFFPRATSICFWTTPKFSLGNFTKCFHFPNFQKTSVATDRSIYIALTSSVLDVTKSYVTNKYRRRHFYPRNRRCLRHPAVGWRHAVLSWYPTWPTCPVLVWPLLLRHIPSSPLAFSLYCFCLPRLTTRLSQYMGSFGQRKHKKLAKQIDLEFCGPFEGISPLPRNTEANSRLHSVLLSAKQANPT